MAKSLTVSPRAERHLGLLTGTVVGVVVLACLYWAQLILIPVALAIFLAFLLSPPVTVMQRRGLGRVPAVLVVVLSAALVTGGLGWMISHQIIGLVDSLPEYSENIKGKIKRFRAATQSTTVERIEHLFQEITGEWKAAKPSPKEPAQKPADVIPAPERPPAVVVQPDSPAWLARLPSVLGHLAETAGAMALTMVLLIFMLVKREDLRNRLLRLIGHGRLTVTTKAVDDAGQRISRFLMMQVVVNGAFGAALAVGLYVIGLKYAILWGFLAAILRYVPYLGSTIAALLPLTLSMALFENWAPMFFVAGLFAALELVTFNIVEPKLFGQSIGVSEVALLIAAAIWAFLWGPIGLVLSNPLTVCLVVLGKYVPQLKFLDVLLGDEPALEPHQSFYQRLLARDEAEATDLVLDHINSHGKDQVYDEMLAPALNCLKRDRDDLTDADEQFVLTAIDNLLKLMQDHRAAEHTKEDAADTEGRVESDHPKVHLLGFAGDEADRLGVEMLRQLLDPKKWEVEILSEELLIAEQVARASELDQPILCIGSLPPGGLARARHLCKRLQGSLPDSKIIVGRWGLKAQVEATQEALREAGADLMCTSLIETRTQLNGWLPVFEQAASHRDNDNDSVELEHLVSSRG